MNLNEGSKSYHDEANIYDLFSQAEDKPGKIRDYLYPHIEGKVVLDLGCGTGKYISVFSEIARQYIGLDISSDQLAIAKKKTNIPLLCASAENIPLPDKSVDTIISTWVLGTIMSDVRRKNGLTEAERVCRGTIYLVENDVGGKFEEVRGRYPDIQRTAAYNAWLEAQGFRAATRFNTEFQFDSTDEAKQVFGSIWGADVGKRITDRIIEQKIVIYRKDMLG
jgi:ubiquinone/menaquinone biosynthesis C-methylase UbiE